ncbi:MAG: hypothetical protein BWX92_04056 [Deltaproteobacteria bacterium ADurb.Bin135]|nr:MAG: hypothetical protein BWX92_04056 [Deltaproteobacteria bacterium ADurb.Bin135]
MFRNPFTRFQFTAQSHQFFVKGFFFFCGFIDVVVIVDVDSPGFFQGFFLVGLVLGILPFGFDSTTVEFIGLVVVFKASEVFVDVFQVAFHEVEGHFPSDNKFHMVFIEDIDVVFAVKASVHHQFHFVKP